MDSEEKTTIEDNGTVETNNTVSDELLEFKKELAGEIADQLLGKNSDAITFFIKSAIKNYLIDENTATDTLIDGLIGGLGEIGLLPSEIKRYREMLSKANTKSDLEDLRKTIFSEIGKPQQISTSAQESNTQDEKIDEPSGETKEDGKEQIVDNNGKEEGFTDGKAESTDGKVESANGIVEKACQIAVDIANNDSYGYEWGGTGNKNGKKGFDCQGFVRYCYIQTGINVPPSGGCGNMKKDFEKVGFECITFNKNEALKPGDILVDPNKHTEMCVAENKIAGAHSNKDGKAGDSGGEEISVRSAKSSLSYWKPKFILRYKGDMA